VAPTSPPPEPIPAPQVGYSRFLNHERHPRIARDSQGSGRFGDPEIARGIPGGRPGPRGQNESSEIPSPSEYWKNPIRRYAGERDHHGTDEGEPGRRRFFFPRKETNLPPRSAVRLVVKVMCLVPGPGPNPGGVPGKEEPPHPVICHSRRKLSPLRPRTVPPPPLPLRAHLWWGGWAEGVVRFKSFAPCSSGP